MNANIQWLEGPGQLGLITWWDGTGTPDPAVKTLQTQINTQLTKLNWQPIGVDGKLGKQTCGALAWLGDPKISPKVDWTKIDPTLSAQAAAACSGHPYTYPTPVGQTQPVNPTPSTAEVDLPWGQDSERTKQVQAQINTLLSELGYNPIPVSGKLDALTCGALQVLDEETGAGGWVNNYGGNCESYTKPTKKAPLPPPPPSPVDPEPEPEPPPQMEPAPTTTPVKKGGFNWGLALLAGAAVVAIGFAVKGAATGSAGAA